METATKWSRCRKVTTNLFVFTPLFQWQSARNMSSVTPHFPPAISRFLRHIFVNIAFMVCAFSPLYAAPVSKYAILVSEKTAADKEWKRVVDTLERKHEAVVHTYKTGIAEAERGIQKQFPLYLALVATPEEVDRDVVIDLHRMSRRMDADPYGDFIWGIVTGFQADDALRIAEDKGPLLIQRALASTRMPLDSLREARLLDDAPTSRDKGAIETKTLDGRVRKQFLGDDGAGLVSSFGEYWENAVPQLVVTSGAGTSLSIQMPFGSGALAAHENQFFSVSKDRVPAMELMGPMVAPDNLRSFLATIAAKPLSPSAAGKVWLASGNSLVGDIRRSRHSFAITALSAGGCNQFMGYAATTWYGGMGNGALRLLLDAPGAVSLSEAFFLQNQVMIERLEGEFSKVKNIDYRFSDMELAGKDPKFQSMLRATGAAPDRDAIGHLYDRDVVAFFGDPGWRAMIDPEGWTGPKTRFLRNGRALLLEVSGGKPNSEGAPIIRVFSERVPGARVLGMHEGVVATESFIIVRKPKFDDHGHYRVGIHGVESEE